MRSASHLDSACWDGDDEIHGFLRRFAQLRVLRHPVCFAQGDGGNAVAVKPSTLVGEFVLGHVQIAIGFLVIDQELQPQSDDILVLVVVMVVPGAQEGEQCQAGRGGVRLNHDRFGRPSGLFRTAAIKLQRPSAACCRER